MRLLQILLVGLAVALLATPAQARHRCHSRHHHNGGCQSPEPALAAPASKVQVTVSPRVFGPRVNVNVCNCQSCGPTQAAPAKVKIQE